MNTSINSENKSDSWNHSAWSSYIRTKVPRYENMDEEDIEEHLSTGMPSAKWAHRARKLQSRRWAKFKQPQLDSYR